MQFRSGCERGQCASDFRLCRFAIRVELLLSQWRALSPADVINRSGKHTAKLVHLQTFADFRSQASQDLVMPGDIIIVQRNLINREVWEAIDYYRALRKCVVADLDDDYPSLPWSNPAHEFWIRNSANLPEAPIALLTEGLKHCDALTSPSKVILEDWKGIVPGAWVPNFAQGNWYLNLPKPPKREKIIIGWGGSVSHLDSWLFSGAKEAIEEICAERKDIALLLCGNDPRLVDRFEVTKEQKFVQSGVPPTEWPKVVAQFDIGVAPLDLREGDKSYDNRRSWIKCLEYILCGVPWVASKCRVYEDFEQYGKCIENTKEAWKSALLEKIDNLGFAKRAANRNRKIGWQNTLEANIDRLAEIYERIGLQSLPQLPQAFYVHWTSDEKTRRERMEVAREEIKTMPLPPQLDQSILDTIQVAATMAAGRLVPAIDWRGVNLAENMRYDLTQQINRWLLSK